MTTGKVVLLFLAGAMVYTTGLTALIVHQLP
jgi:hypothetical protein